MTNTGYHAAKVRAKIIENGPKPWLWNAMLAAKMIATFPAGLYRAEDFVAIMNARVQWKERPKRWSRWPLPQEASGGFVVVLPDTKQSLVGWRREMLHGHTVRLATHVLWCEAEQDAILTHMRFGGG